MYTFNRENKFSSFLVFNVVASMTTKQLTSMDGLIAAGQLKQLAALNLMILIN